MNFNFFFTAKDFINLQSFLKNGVNLIINLTRYVNLLFFIFILAFLISSCRDPVIMTPLEISEVGLCHFLEDNRFNKFLRDNMVGTILERKEVRGDNLFGCEFTIERKDETLLPLTIQLFTKPNSEKKTDWSTSKLKDLSTLGFKHSDGKVDTYVEINDLPFFAVWCNENKAIWWVIDQNSFLIAYPLQVNANFSVKEAIESAKFIHGRIELK